MNIFFADDDIARIILTLTEAAWSYKTPPRPSPQREGKGRRGRREGRERKERNGGAARSANLGGCKGRAANGGEGKNGRWYRPVYMDARRKGKHRIKQNKAEIGKICIFLGFCLHLCKKSSIFAHDFA